MKYNKDIENLNEDEQVNENIEKKAKVYKKRIEIIGIVFVIIAFFIPTAIAFTDVGSSIYNNYVEARIEKETLELYNEYRMSDISFDDIKVVDNISGGVAIDIKGINPAAFATAFRAVNIKYGKKSVEDLTEYDLFKATIYSRGMEYTLFEINKNSDEYVFYTYPKAWKEARNKDVVESVKVFYNIFELCINEEDIDICTTFLNNWCYCDNTVASVLLPLIYSRTCADMYAKPVVYLYPTEKIDIDITIDGVDFTTTYPKYEDKWSVTAYPNGTLVDKNNREYNYLYWEGNAKTNYDLSEGFVVPKNEYIVFLESKLDYIGLTDKEACDFISFWLPQMNEYDYVQVHFCGNYTDIVKKNYSILPDNELNLCVVFRGLEKPIEVKEQDISWYKDFKREGFVVVEWGGVFLK